VFSLAQAEPRSSGASETILSYARQLDTKFRNIIVSNRRNCAQVIPPILEMGMHSKAPTLRLFYGASHDQIPAILSPGHVLNQQQSLLYMESHEQPENIQCG